MTRKLKSMPVPALFHGRFQAHRRGDRIKIDLLKPCSPGILEIRRRSLSGQDVVLEKVTLGGFVVQEMRNIYPECPLALSYLPCGRTAIACNRYKV